MVTPWQVGYAGLVRTVASGLLAALLAAAPAWAAESLSGDFQDWSVVCDNVRHCEAVGYQDGSADDMPVALWIGRDAGPGGQASGTLYLQTDDQVDMTHVTAIVGHKRLALTLEGGSGLSDESFKALLAVMKDADEATFTVGKTKWVLSLAGLKASLLKMDDVQGRVGTEGALLRVGKKPESQVPKAPSAPVLRMVKWLPGNVGDEALTKQVLATVKDRSCWDILPDDETPDTALVHVSAKQVIVARVCGRGAYQESWRLWIANAQPPYAPKPLDMPGVGSEPIGLSLDNGRASSYAKIRGIGDCGDEHGWVWTGERFELEYAEIAGQCKGIPGGVTQRSYTAIVK